MDLRQLRYFVGIVQAGSLSRAADQLHVAQSAISHHLASLESEVGRQLVTRGPKGILLTEAGGVLYRHAEAILRHVEFAKQDALNVLNVPSGRVSIGFPVALASLLAYELFVRIRTAYPQILLYLVDGNSGLLRERLNNGRLDIALLLTGQAERGLAVEPLVLEELFYATAEQDHSPVRIADVARHPLLVPGPDSGIQRDAREVFEKHGLSLEPIGECDSLNTMRELVAAGVGNSIMTWSGLHGGAPRIALNYRRFADAKMVRPVSLCFSEVGLRSPAIEAVAQIAGPRTGRKRHLAGRHADRACRGAVRFAGPQRRVKAGHSRAVAQLQAGCAPKNEKWQRPSQGPRLIDRASAAGDQPGGLVAA
jgi:LysR family nitrogen assimilation transcriptional regulator